MRTAKVKESLQKLTQSGLEFGAVIDVGIQHATPALIESFPNVHHYLFEPVEEYYPYIRENYAGLSYDLVEAAVADFDGQIFLKTEKKTRRNEVSHSYITENSSACTRSVNAVRLDTYFSQLAQPHNFPYLLKIDVEGPDVPLQILKGAEEILRNTAIVMIEMTVDRFMERARFLDEIGFDVWDICDLCYYADCLWQADVFFVRKEIKSENINLRPMHERPMRRELWQSGF